VDGGQRANINEKEAKTVRILFRLYLELGTVKALRAEADQQGLVTKRRYGSDGNQTGGKLFTRGHLYQLLRNPLYVGQVSHKGALYPGQHKAIVDPMTFDAVQRKLENNAAARRSATNAKAPSLLTGLVWDDTGDRLCPTHANKNGRRYRYYISKRLMQGTSETGDGWRLPAYQLESAIIDGLGAFLKDEMRLFKALQPVNTQPDSLRTALQSAAKIADRLKDPQMLRCLLHRVIISRDTICLSVRRSALIEALDGTKPGGPDNRNEVFKLVVPVRLKRRGVEAKLIIGAMENDAREPDANLIQLIARSHGWMDQLIKGEVTSIKEIATRDGLDAGDVSRFLPLAFLAPYIVEAIFAGSQPTELTAETLRRACPLPMDWQDQRRRLSFSA
jgi:hypothetical protein